MTEDNNESSRRSFACQLEKYTLAEKQKRGECIEMFKKEYDVQVECLKGKTSIRCQTQKVYTTGYWEFMLHFHSYIIVLLILLKLIFHYWLLITLKY